MFTRSKVLRVDTRTLVLACFIEGVHDKSLLAQRGRGRRSFICFVLHLTTSPPFPTFPFYFIFICSFFFPRTTAKAILYRVNFFVRRIFTACSEFAFDFSTLLGIFCTISSVFDSPLPGNFLLLCFHNFLQACV